jgi:transcriptional regulator NrdR family protein
MICPKCGNTRTSVRDTRRFDTVVFRIRFCDACNFYFRTEEVVIVNEANSASDKFANQGSWQPR